MVSLPRASYRLLLVLISVATLGNAPALSALVLCLEDDGHAAIEYPRNGKAAAARPTRPPCMPRSTQAIAALAPMSP